MHLIEVTRDRSCFEREERSAGDDLAKIRKWFADYLHWLPTSKNGQDEMKAANNHGTCWVDAGGRVRSVRGRSGKTRRISASDSRRCSSPSRWPPMAASRRSFGAPNLTATASSTSTRWRRSARSFPRQRQPLDLSTPDGKNMRKGVEFMYPYITDKSTGRKKPDVMFWEFWPVRSPVLLFAGLAYTEQKYLETLEDVGSKSNQ